MMETPRRELTPSRLGRGLVLGIAAGAAIYVGLAAWGDWSEVAARLGQFRWSMALAGTLLAALNYLLRFVKWEYYLGRLGIDCPRGRSFGIFLSGFSLTVTPGKVGEVLKSYLLRDWQGVAMARTMPVVLAERVSDLIALLALSVVGIGGIASLESPRRLLLAGTALIAALVVAVSWEQLGEALSRIVERLPVVGRLGPKLREFSQATRELHRPVPLLVAVTLSILAWACECLAFQLVLGGFPGATASLQLATFIYATMTVAGALSFVPGGLGVTEIGMVELLVVTAQGVDRQTALAATFVTRGCTLWFAVLVGLVALWWVQPGQPRS